MAEALKVVVIGKGGEVVGGLMSSLGTYVVALQEPLHTASHSLARVDNLDISMDNNSLYIRA